MMMVKCTNCMKEFDECEVVYDGDDDMEYCPMCGECGCLMDLTEVQNDD
nr:MAG TPA: zinc-ribbon domain protein [Caudoviricetes sp.]